MEKFFPANFGLSLRGGPESRGAEGRELRREVWVLGKAEEQGEHCSSKERLGAPCFITRSLPPSESPSRRSTGITRGSFCTLPDRRFTATRPLCSSSFLYCTAPFPLYFEGLLQIFTRICMYLLMSFSLNPSGTLFSVLTQQHQWAVYREGTSCTVQALSKKSQKMGLCHSYPHQPDWVPARWSTTAPPHTPLPHPLSCSGTSWQRFTRVQPSWVGKFSSSLIRRVWKIGREGTTIGHFPLRTAIDI